jgi:hypothetical protein
MTDSRQTDENDFDSVRTLLRGFDIEPITRPDADEAIRRGRRRRRARTWDAGLAAVAVAVVVAGAAFTVWGPSLGVPSPAPTTSTPSTLIDATTDGAARFDGGEAVRTTAIEACVPGRAAGTSVRVEGRLVMVSMDPSEAYTGPSTVTVSEVTRCGSTAPVTLSEATVTLTWRFQVVRESSLEGLTCDSVGITSDLRCSTEIAPGGRSATISVATSATARGVSSGSLHIDVGNIDVYPLTGITVTRAWGEVSVTGRVDAGGPVFSLPS